MSTILCARQQQFDRDAAGDSRAKAKVKTDMLAKIEKAELVLSSFRGPDKINVPNWKIAVGFLLPMFSPDKAASKIQTVPLIEAKPTEIKRDYKKQWDVLMHGERDCKGSC